MSADPYAQLMSVPVVGRLAARVGLPCPPALVRAAEGAAVCEAGALVGGAPEGQLEAPLAAVLGELGVPSGVLTAGARFGALLFDASGIADSAQLVELHRFFHPAVAALASNGRVIVLGRPPELAPSLRAHTAQRALEGFTRALGKELGRRGSTVQLLRVALGAELAMASTLRFLLSPASAYLSGQVIRLSAPAVDPTPRAAAQAPLAGRTALVTGAARGIGAAISRLLAREGAHVVGLDVPAAQPELSQLMQRLGGEPMELDITAADAPRVILERFVQGIDVLVHNAGVTIDRTLARMKAGRWSKLMEINLSSEERINEAVLAEGALRPGGRIVCMSSIAGIAGNAGQTNYSTSKAGVIGMVAALAPVLAAEHGATINAIAPGFIETGMTAAMPFAIREAGRRMNSLLQGGLPIDVAETVAWLAAPDSGAVNGNVVRVCGQSLLGA